MADDVERGIDGIFAEHAYWRCVSVYAAAGTTLGALAGHVTPLTPAGGALLGFAGGGIVGLRACRDIDGRLRSRMFDASRPVSEADVRRLVAETARAYPDRSGREILDLLIAARLAAGREPSRYRC